MLLVALVGLEIRTCVLFVSEGSFTVVVVVIGAACLAFFIGNFMVII